MYLDIITIMDIHVLNSKGQIFLTNILSIY
jgi:hypothetical protein